MAELRNDVMRYHWLLATAGIATYMGRYFATHTVGMCRAFLLQAGTIYVHYWARVRKASSDLSPVYLPLTCDIFPPRTPEE